MAALLRANGIPAGLCYQRLSVGAFGPPYCLHGLNAVYLKQFGWYRIDARGNKTGLFADFCPPTKKLAFSIVGHLERDFPEIWEEPLPIVIEVLTQIDTVGLDNEHLPDLEIVQR